MRDRERQIRELSSALAMDLSVCNRDPDLGCLTAQEIADAVVGAFKEFSDQEGGSDESRQRRLRARLWHLGRKVAGELRQVIHPDP